MPASSEKAVPGFDRRLPSFFIIGAMRSGTTSLASYLGQHPQIFLPAQKELHFFDVQFERGVDWYAGHFDEVTGEVAVGEATQTYMYDRRAVERLAATLPEARLIAILRNPVDRAYSHFRHNETRGRETLTFESALAAESERLSSHDPRIRYRFGYVDRGRYHQQLVRVAELFRRKALHVLLLDDLTATPASTYQQVCEFIGVDGAFRPDNLGQPLNAYLTFRSVRVRNASKRLPHTLRRVVGRVNTRASQYPPIRPATRQALEETFSADNAALSAWLGRDLPW